MSFPQKRPSSKEATGRRGQSQRPLRQRKRRTGEGAGGEGGWRSGPAERSGTSFGKRGPRRPADARGDMPARRSAPLQSAGPSTSKLQKRLAEAGLGSRRAMEELIQTGEVRVNGRVARLGARVALDDVISVRGSPLLERHPERRAREPRVVLYHKPEGEIVSKRDPEGRPSVFDRISIVQRGRWLAVGRLDFNTCGLLVFTDSGELANRLTHPRFQQVRDYAVRVIGELNEEQITRMRRGIELEDGAARFELLESQGGEGSNRWYRVRVREGRNRLVRRMFAAAGVTVSRLMRTRFGPFDLPPQLKRGQWQRLEAREVKEMLKVLESDAGAVPTRRARRDSAVSRPARPREGPSGAAKKPHRPRRLYQSS
jgi:23S rRNA pseudouridine2605 synthase